MSKYVENMFPFAETKLWKMIATRFAGVPTSMLEIGVYEGQCAEWCCQQILTHPESRYTGLDNWEYVRGGFQTGLTPADVESSARDNLSRFRDRVTLIKGKSVDILASHRFDLESFDLIYIDGDHTPPGVRADSIFCWPLLKVDGWMVWDDYEGARDKPANQRPPAGIDPFVNSRRPEEIDVFWKGYQLAARKLATLIRY